MRAGYGKTEITPPLGVELAGYGYYLKRRATRVDDPLFVRAVALEDRGRTYVVVSCDILGLNRGIVGRVRAALLDKHAIPPSHVLIVSIQRTPPRPPSRTRAAARFARNTWKRCPARFWPRARTRFRTCGA